MASVTFQGVHKTYPGGNVAVSGLDLAIEDGEFMVLVGPSGCGKTTALRMVAGLEEITDGQLMIGDEVVNTVEPRKRDVAMVFQNYALYPHMSIFQNIAFPLASRGMKKDEIRVSVERVAVMLGLEEMLGRKPRTLSGGQRQRVAMGRALVREPQVFLMDEPLSNLDAKLRVQMRAEISKLQQDIGVTTIYVTHDQVEAMTMGDRIAVMRKGVLQQLGPSQELYDHPTNLFVATFIGSPAMNLFRGRVERADGGLCVILRNQRVVLSASLPSLDGLAAFEGRDVALGIRPEALGEATADDRGSARLHGTVRLVEALGPERLVHADIEADPVLTEEVLEVAEDTDAAAVQSLQDEAASHVVPVVARFDTESRVSAGDQVEFAFRSDRLHFFDLNEGRVIA